MDASPLSDRELEIVERASTGATDAMIADELGLRPAALEKCWATILLKLHAQSRSEAIASYASGHAQRIAEVDTQLRAEVEELRSALERFALSAELQGSVLDHVGEGVAITDRAGIVVFSNIRFASMLGLRPGEVLGRLLYDLVGRAEAYGLRQDLEVGNFGGAAEHEVDYVSTDGRRRQLKFSAVASPRAEAEGGGMVVVVADVTQRKRLESALQRALAQSEERRRHLEAVLEIMPIGVALYAIGGEVVRANSRMRALWGPRVARLPTTEELAMIDCRWSSSGEPVEKTGWATRRVLAGEETATSMDVTISGEDGCRRRILSAAAAIHGEGGTVTGAILASVDVSHAYVGEATETDSSGFVLDAQMARLVEIVESLGGGAAPADSQAPSLAEQPDCEEESREP
jgi:PAS domain S-box-containing protein